MSNLNNITGEELRERLVVAEMIMKKLYARNKDLEAALKKKRDGFVTQNSFFPKENEEPEESEEEIGCSECPKLRDRNDKLSKEVESMKA